MTSWGGTSCTTVRNDTRIIRSIGKNTKAMPGPLALSSRRPSRNTTARSYSFRILMLKTSHKATMTTTRTVPIPTPPFMKPPSRIAAASGALLHVKHQIVNAEDAHLGAHPDRSRRAGVPVLSVHEHASLGIEIGQGRAALALQAGRSRRRLVPRVPDDQGRQVCLVARDRSRDRQDGPARHAQGRHAGLALEEHHSAAGQ